MIGLTFPTSDGADFTNYHTVAVLAGWIKKNIPNEQVLFSRDLETLADCGEVWCTANTESMTEVNNTAKTLTDTGVRFIAGGHQVTHCPESLRYGQVFLGPLDDTASVVPDWSLCLDSTKQFVTMSSYGCPFSCGFCASRLFWGGYSTKPIDAFVNELMTARELGFTYVNIFDDLFAANPKRLSEVVEQLRARDLLSKLEFGCLVRADIAEPKRLALLKEMGVKNIAFGAESGSDRVLSLMNKKTTTLQNQQAVDNIVAAGMGGCCSLIVGYPGETEEDLSQTIGFIRKNRDKILIRAYQCVPYPGTAVWEVFKKMHSVDTLVFDWSRLRMEKPDWDKYLPLVSYDKKKLIDVVEHTKDI